MKMEVTLLSDFADLLSITDGLNPAQFLPQADVPRAYPALQVGNPPPGLLLEPGAAGVFPQPLS